MIFVKLYSGWNYIMELKHTFIYYSITNSIQREVRISRGDVRYENLRIYSQSGHSPSGTYSIQNFRHGLTKVSMRREHSGKFWEIAGKCPLVMGTLVRLPWRKF